jgi:hypothetical protein
MFARPVYYLAALGLPADFDAVTAEDVKKAYSALATNGMHTDNGGDAETWALITAAYNEVKAMFAKKRGRSESNSDKRWLAAWDALQRPSTRPSEPKAAGTDEPKADGEKFVFEEKDGESKDDRRKRYARQSQQFRYARDPEFAAKRKASSLKSHAKKAARDKAAKEAAAAGSAVA